MVTLKYKKHYMKKHKYSPKELLQFQKIILQKISLTEQLIKELSPNPNNLIAQKFNPIDDANTHSQLEENSILLENQLKNLNNYKEALFKIQNQSYGICQISQKLIPKQRLLANPLAKTII
jgi:DnaK suppressor protein